MRLRERSLLLLALLMLVIGLTPVSAQSSVTLTVWDDFTSDGDQAMMQQLDARFEQAHAGVTVQREAHTRDELADAMANSSAPDVSMIPNLAASAQAGLLLPLDAYADQYGWPSRTSASLLARTQVNDQLFGISATAEIVGMFYNRAIFQQLRLSVPTTWDDLEADLDVIQSGGFVPISFGAADPSAAADSFGALAHAYSNLSDVANLVNSAPGATFLTEGDIDAAQTLSDWIDAGDFSPGFVRMDSAAALAEFTGGKSALWLARSTNAGAIRAALGIDGAGFFLLPSPIGDEVAPAAGGLGLPYAIRMTSPNADLAAQYIDFMTGAAAADALLAGGILPATMVDPSTLQPGTLSADLVAAWSAVSAADKLGYDLSAALPDIGATVQQLAAKQLDAEAFADQLDQDYQAGR